MREYVESKTTRIMMETVPHVTSGLGLRKFQADGFLLTRVYHRLHTGLLMFYTKRKSLDSIKQECVTDCMVEYTLISHYESCCRFKCSC